MKNNRRFTGSTVFRFAVLVLLFLGLTGTTCVEERELDVVVAADLTAEFAAVGSDNNYDSEDSFDINEQINLQEIMDENGIEKIESVSVQSAFFRVTQNDPTVGRTISGSVTVRREGNSESALINYSSIQVNNPAYGDWTPIPLQLAGVNVINGVLEDLLHPPVPPSVMTVVFHSFGTSEPENVATNFRYEVMVRLNVVGLVKVDVIEGP